MAKLNDLQTYRNDGMALAYKIVKEKGIEGLEEELKFRNITGIHTHLTKTELQKIEEVFKQQVIKYYQAASLYILKEKYQFGKVKLKNYFTKFEDLCDSVMRDYLSLDDILNYLKEDCKIDLFYKEES